MPSRPMKSFKRSKRTLDEIKNDLTQYCLRAGDLQFQIVMTQGLLGQVNNTLCELNQEYAQVQERLAKEAKQETQTKTEATPEPTPSTETKDADAQLN